MRACLTVLVLVLLLVSVLAGCAPGANQFKGTASEHGRVAGFWVGLWQGLIAPFVFVACLFKSNLNIYEVHNNGAWYNLGYLLGWPASSVVAASRRGAESESRPLVLGKKAGLKRKEIGRAHVWT